VLNSTKQLAVRERPLTFGDILQTDTNNQQLKTNTEGTREETTQKYTFKGLNPLAIRPEQ
jgi:hypothetical protein